MDPWILGFTAGAAARAAGAAASAAAIICIYVVIIGRGALCFFEASQCDPLREYARSLAQILRSKAGKLVSSSTGRAISL